MPCFTPFSMEPESPGHDRRVWGDFARGRRTGGSLLIGRVSGRHGGGGGALTYGTYAREVTSESSVQVQERKRSLIKALESKSHPRSLAAMSILDHSFMFSNVMV